jgi:hypothetical protein
MSLLQTVPGQVQEDADAPKSDTRLPDSRDGKGTPPTPPEQNAAGGGGSLTRVTANFVPRSMAALEEVSARTGDSRTDILNRAVLVYKAFLEMSVDDVLTVIGPDGTQEKIRFI